MELREAHWYDKGTDAAPVKVGGVVVVHNQNQPSGFWKLARVEPTITGRNGKIRGAEVRVAASHVQPTVLQRPIQCLFPLEIKVQELAQLQSKACLHLIPFNALRNLVSEPVPCEAH